MKTTLRWVLTLCPWLLSLVFGIEMQLSISQTKQALNAAARHMQIAKEWQRLYEKCANNHYHLTRLPPNTQ